jgi:hypothetical protein
MVKCGVLFEVQAKFLSTIWTSFGFNGNTYYCNLTSLPTLVQKLVVICGYQTWHEARYSNVTVNCSPSCKNISLIVDSSIKLFNKGNLKYCFQG